ncbi:hypothetical protein D4Q52_18420 [Rhodopseudomonas palustris]|uniref:Uncharacterized protein n=1 Tax=Rhodopseudomonas palustris TaxID=1076 RepID=A0A418V1U0_RHOPL|nr:hypothetical protein D4Q52_18420 [Rhodopseudomonas palustris]
MARIASEVGSRGGLIHPFLLRQSENDVFLSYLSSDAEFHDPHIIQRMSEHPDIGKLAEMMRENETWKFPDMRPWFTYYQLGEQQIDDLGGIHIPSVHENKLASVARVSEATPGA